MILRVPAALLAFLCLSSVVRGSTPVLQSASLREYGNVTARLTPSRAQFDCESAGRADMLLGKLLADSLWDAGTSHVQQTVDYSGRRWIVHSVAGHGSMVAGRVGLTVVAVGGADPAAAAAAAAGDPVLGRAIVAFVPERPYPVALDFYDLRAVRAYNQAPMSSRTGLGRATHWPFIEQFGMGGISVQQPTLGFSSPAPGVVDWTPSDFELREAERRHSLSMPSFTAGGQMPLWLYNEFPRSRAQPSPSALLGAWGGAAAAGASFESWSVSEQERERGDYWFQQAVMSRYGGSPAVGGWQIYAGMPGVEMGYHERSTEYYDYSVTGQIGFRRWLRDAKGLTPASTGVRWYGDRTRFRHWSDVAIPDVRFVFGHPDVDSTRLNAGWSWRKAGSETEPPRENDAGWTPVTLPPSQEMTLLPNGRSWMRCTFRNNIRRSPAAKLWLVCCTGMKSRDGVGVWLNGNRLGAFHDEGGDFVVPLASTLLQPSNTLILGLPDLGKLLGPVYVTALEPHRYPFASRGENAQSADVREWQAYSIAAYHRSLFDRARRIDPDRPMIMASGDLSRMGDRVAELAAAEGMAVEQTGREAYYFPWWSGLGIVDGFYSASEASATPAGSSLDRMLSWVLFDGDSAHQLFYDVENYIRREKQDGWFTRNQRRLALIGKALRDTPSIALLWPVHTSLLGDSSPFSWDLGRGELQQAHLDNVYVTEREVENGLVNRFPVLMDCGAAVMDDALIHALEKYVRAGGTYVTIQSTGQHTTLVPNVFPISALTGFRVYNTCESSKIRFEQRLSVLGRWAGAEFDGNGSSLDWQGRQTAVGVGLSLRPAAAEAETLARWADGSTAIGCRRLGRGRVITLGSAFWRAGQDKAGVWRTDSALEIRFLDDLFTSIGVVKSAVSDSPLVWTRKFTTKNGQQDWIIACNNEPAPITSALSLRTGHRPRYVIDLLTNRPVPYSYRDGWVQITGIEVPAQGTRAFAAERGSLAAGLATWWSEKARYWNRRPASRSRMPPARADLERCDSVSTARIDTWQFLTEPELSAADSERWMLPGTTLKGWAKVEPGPWSAQQGKLAGYHGIGLYRASFRTRPEWAGHKIALCMYSFDNPIVYDSAQFYVNGRPVTTVHARFGNQALCTDISDFLRPGENVVSVRVAGGTDLAGLCAPVWVQEQRLFREARSLVLSHTLVGPGAGPGSHAGIDVPASWGTREVFLKLESAAQWCRAVGVNGRLITYNSYGHAFPNLVEIDVSPYIRCGAHNQIDFYTDLAPDGKSGKVPLPPAPCSAVIGCE